MDERQPVEMVVVPRQEEYYSRAEVFGRDASSVFPNESKKLNVLDADKVKEMIGATNFISETQLAELKASGRARVEDGVVSVDKSLAEVLAENKAKKDAEYKQKWEIMKQGKNKPLEADEAQFLDTVLQSQAEKQRAAREAEQQELQAFREALQHRVVTEAEGGSDNEAGNESIFPKANPLRKPASAAASSKASRSTKPLIKPIVKVKARPAGSTDAPQEDAEGNTAQPAKRQRNIDAIELHQHQQKVEPALGLASLLGEYGSGSDSDG